MAGYSETFTKTTGQTIEAADFETEFTAITAAFDESTGHTHDGTADGGAYVPVLAEGDLNNAVTIDSTNNEIEFDIQVSGSPVEQLVIADGVIKPTTDNDIDLGDGTHEFKDLYIDGTANIDSLVADTADINGGTIDGVTIGGATPAAGTFTTANATTLQIGGSSITATAAELNQLDGNVFTSDVTLNNIKAETADITIANNDTEILGITTLGVANSALVIMLASSGGAAVSIATFVSYNDYTLLGVGSSALIDSTGAGKIGLSVSNGVISINNQLGTPVTLTALAFFIA